MPTTAPLRDTRTSLMAVLALTEAIVLTSLFTALPTPFSQLGVPASLILLWFGLFTIAQLRHLLTMSGMPDQRMHGLMLLLFIVLGALLLGLFGVGMNGLLQSFAGALLIWGMGVHLGGSDLSAQFARRLFWAGAIVTSLSTLLNPQTARVALLVGFAPAALLAILLSVQRNVTQARHMSARALATPRWRKATAAILLATLGLVLLDTALLNSSVIAWIVRGLVLVLAIPIAFVLYELVYWVAHLLPLDMFKNLLAPLGLLMGSLQNLAQQSNQLSGQQQTTGGAIDPRLIWGSAMFAIMILIAAFAAQRIKKAARPEAGEDDGAMPSDVEIDDDIPGELQPKRGMPLLSRIFAAATIRLLYARMIREAGRRGQARAVTQTPREFLPELGQAFPGAEGDVSDITTAYEAAHYGTLPDTMEKLNAIMAAWERVRRIPAPPKTKAS